jgi:hypothetical protein
LSSIYSTNFYVYAYLRENGTPYYIGKGTNRRAWNHFKYEIRPPKDRSRVVIMENNLTELGAFALERRYIRWYGRKDINTGILRNKTDGGDGNAGRKYKMSETHKRNLSAAKKGKIPSSVPTLEVDRKTQEFKKNLDEIDSKKYVFDLLFANQI